jgi:hypothetical protein
LLFFNILFYRHKFQINPPLRSSSLIDKAFLGLTPREGNGMIKYILQILNKCGHFKTRVYNILSGSYCHIAVFRYQWPYWPRYRNRYIVVYSIEHTKKYYPIKVSIPSGSRYFYYKGYFGDIWMFCISSLTRSCVQLFVDTK